MLNPCILKTLFLAESIAFFSRFYYAVNQPKIILEYYIFSQNKILKQASPALYHNIYQFYVPFNVSNTRATVC